MVDRADSHIHLFEGGYRESFTKRPGVQIDEIACYQSLAEAHHIRKTLVVTYEAQPWCANNNAFVANAVRSHPWIAPTMYVEPTQPLTIDTLEKFEARGFVGLSFYVKPAIKGSIEVVPSIGDDVWSWLVQHRWLVSANSRKPELAVWPAVLERHGDLRVVVCHMGLPAKVGQPPSAAEVRDALANVLVLARFPETRVKVSGFYTITDPGHDYPHRATWPYLEAILAEFGIDRLLWGSDFPPCLDSVSFPQTFDLFRLMPFFTDADREKLEGGNLLNLLDEVAR